VESLPRAVVRSQMLMQELVWLDCLLLLGIPSVLQAASARDFRETREPWKPRPGDGISSNWLITCRTDQNFQLGSRPRDTPPSFWALACLLVSYRPLARGLLTITPRFAC
jgi:hypothetical protein